MNMIYVMCFLRCVLCIVPPTIFDHFSQCSSPVSGIVEVASKYPQISYCGAKSRRIEPAAVPSGGAFGRTPSTSGFDATAVNSLQQRQSLTLPRIL